MLRPSLARFQTLTGTIGAKRGKRTKGRRNNTGYRGTGKTGSGNEA